VLLKRPGRCHGVSLIPYSPSRRVKSGLFASAPFRLRTTMSKRASQERFRELLNDVAGWAAGFGGRLVLGPPVPDEDIALLPELLGLPVPPGGEVLPDGLREFWGLCAFARVEVPDAEEDGGWRTLPANFRVYSPDEVLDATRWVRIPDDVTLGNRRITTAHLFALAVSDVLPRDAQSIGRIGALLRGGGLERRWRGGPLTGARPSSEPGGWRSRVAPWGTRRPRPPSHEVRGRGMALLALAA
jgi:hypothetical protein